MGGPRTEYNGKLPRYFGLFFHAFSMTHVA